MSKYFIKNAVIDKADIRLERGFIVTSWLQLDYGVSGQGFGGFGLAGAAFTDSKMGEATGPHMGEWVRHVLPIAGVGCWSKIPGKSVRVALTDEGFGGKVVGIGHIIKDQWFYPQDVFDQYKQDGESEDDEVKA